MFSDRLDSDILAWFRARIMPQGAEIATSCLKNPSVEVIAREAVRDQAFGRLIGTQQEVKTGCWRVIRLLETQPVDMRVGRGGHWQHDVPDLQVRLECTTSSDLIAGCSISPLSTFIAHLVEYLARETWCDLPR